MYIDKLTYRYRGGHEWSRYFHKFGVLYEFVSILLPFLSYYYITPVYFIESWEVKKI